MKNIKWTHKIHKTDKNAEKSPLPTNLLVKHCFFFVALFCSHVCHCVKSVQIRKYLSVFSPNAEKYGPEITPYLDTFRAVCSITCKFD